MNSIHSEIKLCQMMLSYMNLLSACICCLKPYAKTPAICPDCIELLRRLNCLGDKSLCVFSHDWRDFQSLGNYEGLLGHLIHQGKFEAKLGVLKQLAILFAEEVLTGYRDLDGLVIPVPMKTSRYLRRGYNQSAFLAKTIASRLGLQYTDKLVQHSGLARVQHKLNRKERSQNMRQAFFCKGKVPERVFVVDDVFTTGATARAMCHCLKAAGATHVEIWVLAKAE